MQDVVVLSGVEVGLRCHLVEDVWPSLFGDRGQIRIVVASVALG